MIVENLLPSDFIEHEFFEEMVKYFNREVFEKKTVYLTCDYKKLPSYGKDVIVICTAGDERGIPPTYAKNVGFVFKHHLDYPNVNNVYHIPLTPVDGFEGNSLIPILERKYDICFVGRNNKRKSMLKEVGKFVENRKDLNCYIYDTGNKWKKGLDVKEYSRVMSNSKIALSPTGNVRCECLRYTEAIKCGCAIVACPHPQIPCFTDSGVSYVEKDWSNFGKVVNFLLEKKNLLKATESSQMAWRKYFSPKAVGKYIDKIVRSGK